MGKTLTRVELFELVWTHPRTRLAKEFGISDVAIGKHCTRANIPAPPAGYWARQKFGKASTRPQLPLRLPGQASEIILGDPDRRWYWPQAEDLNEPLEPTIFSESIEVQVSAALKQIGKIQPSRDLSNPHAGLKRLLASEEKRREKYKNSTWGNFYKPHFDAPHYQRQLRIFNSLAHGLGRVFGRPEVYAYDEWIQGYGTFQYLRLRAADNDADLELEFLEPGERRESRRDKGVARTTLRLGKEGSKLGFQDWVDLPNQKLERQVEGVVTALLFRAERSLRLHAQLFFERRVELRKEMLEKIEIAKREKERKRLEAIAAHHRKVRQEILELSQQWRAANDIRDMVTALGMHPDLTQWSSSQFDRWRDEALNVADSLDPIKHSLSDLLLTFSSPPDASAP